jgi:type II secretory pathway component PulF
MLWKLSVVRKYWIGTAFRLLGLLLVAGLPLVPAMETVGRAVPQVVFRRQWLRTIYFCKQGKRVSEALRYAGIADEITGLISVLESQGRLAEGVQKTGDTLHARFSQQMTSLSGILEPAAILLVGGWVALIVLSMMMPLWRWGQLVS